nr:hypothetical protein Iba_chr12aCG4220 [Ipomoea batatas]
MLLSGEKGRKSIRSSRKYCEENGLLLTTMPGGYSESDTLRPAYLTLHKGYSESENPGSSFGKVSFERKVEARLHVLSALSRMRDKSHSVARLVFDISYNLLVCEIAIELEARSSGGRRRRGMESTAPCSEERKRGSHQADPTGQQNGSLSTRRQTR